MNEDEEFKPVPVTTLPNGAVQCGDIIHEPWPNLQIHPYRSLEHINDIIRAAPGSRFWEFAERIPEEVRQLARAVPSYQWGFVEMCACHERGRALAENCPALAVLLLNSHLPTLHGARPDYVRAMLRLPWREMLLALGLPGRPRTMRILAKVPIEHCRSNTMAELGRALSRVGPNWLHVLPHLRRVTRDTVGLLRLDPRLVTPKLFRASSESDWDEEPVAWTVGSIQSLRSELGRRGDWPYGSLDFEQLKLVEGRFNDAVMHDCMLPFPPAPFPGRPSEIEPIRCYDRLVVESAAVENCSVTFLGDILAGNSYLYAVFHPERATVALRRDESGAWIMQDLRAVRNGEVSMETKNFINEWIFAQEQSRANTQAE